MAEPNLTATRAHALEFLRTVSGIDAIDLAPALLDEVFLGLAAGALPAGRGPNWIDDLIRHLRGAHKPLRRARLCLTHDVDFTTSRDQGRKFLRRLTRAFTGDGSKSRALLNALGSLVRMTTQPAGPERYGDFMDWLRLEERFGCRSTFFFLPFPGTHAHVLDGDYRFTDRVCFDRRMIRVSDMMREIASAGWEIGLHGSYNSATVPGLLAQQKESVEQIIGQEVRSVRQHFLNLVPGVTHQLQAAAGFQVDSTIGHTRGIGLKIGTSHPFRVWDTVGHRPLPLVEVPLIAMDTPLLLMGLTRRGSSWAVQELKRIGAGIAEAGGVFCLNWHPHNLPVPQLQEVYLELLSWSRDIQAESLRMDAFTKVP